MEERHVRSVVKAVSYRFLAMIVTMLIVFVFTRKLALSIGVGLVELLAKIFFFYIHERVWGKISWGKHKHPLEDIPVKKELTPEDRKKVEDQLRSLGYL